MSKHFSRHGLFDLRAAEKRVQFPDEIARINRMMHDISPDLDRAMDLSNKPAERLKAIASILLSSIQGWMQLRPEEFCLPENQKIIRDLREYFQKLEEFPERYRKLKGL